MTWLKLLHQRDWRYQLSRVVPVRMRSIYGVVGQTALAEGGILEQTGEWRESATWWQWRGHVYRSHITRVV